jgi:hypothetical protein
VETVWYLENFVLFVINVVVGVVSLRAYFDSVDRVRPLFYLGVSSILGVLASVASVALSLSSMPDHAYADGSLTIQFVGLFDACIWGWAVCALIERFKRVQGRGLQEKPTNA